ncbi:MAG: ribokinase [Alphaproteobacteria bacterium]|nr:ribokinase [Alphaproteobacteria bacterium]
MSAPHITVVGSVNLDLVATAARLPVAGETVTGATLERHPGGKGANQALAARRLGMEVRLLCRVGADAMAEEALALVRAEGVDLTGCSVDPGAATGVALIAVSVQGENQIIVAPGANAVFLPVHLPEQIDGALICQLELPVETVAKAVESASGFVCVNLAPAREIPESILGRADLVVVNEVEAAWFGDALNRASGLVAITAGSRGARLLRAGALVAAAPAFAIQPVDTTGAGDAFVAALTVALLEELSPQQALRFACAAGALAATRRGAQPSMPTRTEIEAFLAARNRGDQ